MALDISLGNLLRSAKQNVGNFLGPRSGLLNLT